MAVPTAAARPCAAWKLPQSKYCPLGQAQFLHGFGNHLVNVAVAAAGAIVGGFLGGSGFAFEDLVEAF